MPKHIKYSSYLVEALVLNIVLRKAAVWNKKSNRGLITH